MNKKQNKTTNLVMMALFGLITLALALMILGGMLRQQNNSTDTIDSFDECAAAGYPIMESYPEQCAVPGGKTFTKQY